MIKLLTWSRISNRKYLFAIFIVCYVVTFGVNPNQSSTLVSRNAAVEAVIWDGNQISNIHLNTGEIVSSGVTGESGLVWPIGGGIGAVYQSGLWIAAGKVNGNEEIRTAASEYSSEYGPGVINGDTTSGHIYQIHRAEIEALLNNDWATFSSMSLMLPVSIISGYDIHTELVSTSLPTNDLMNWPISEGAPWVDANNDGIYNPPDGDHPDIIGDMFHWYVMNDGNPATHTLWNTAPLGLEVRVAQFGFDHPGVIGNTLFVKFQIINAAANQLDSMFISIFSDPDLGDNGDDRAGCDSSLNLGFWYNDSNWDDEYGNNPPAGGYVFLQTPIVPSIGDTGWVSGEMITDYKNLPMSSFTPYICGGGLVYGQPNTASAAYSNMNGLDLSGNSHTNPITGNTTVFPWDGDIMNSTGWIDNLFGCGDRYFLITTGPLQMAPGDSQEVVLAIFISQGLNNYSSAGALKGDHHWIKTAWESDFSVFGPPAVVVQDINPVNSEGIGPFTWSYKLTELPGWSLSSGNSWFHYRINSLQDSIALMETVIGDTIIGSLTVDFPNITGTTTMQYWISMQTDTGIEQNWPSGAPDYNWDTFIFGSDTIAPAVSEVTELENVHYLLYFEKSVSAKIIDDRMPVIPILKWRNDEGIINMDSMALIDSMNATFSGVLSGTPGHWNDTIYYWIEAVDMSLNQNLTISELNYIIANRTYEVIGPWDHYVDQPWDLWKNGILTSWSTPSAWNKVLKLDAMETGISDTLTYLRTIDLSNFDVAGLAFNTVYSLDINENYGYLEISTDGQNWSLLKSFTGDVANYEELISLTDYIGNEEVSIRFRADRTTNQVFTWVIDDITLHMDSTRLSLDPAAKIPNKIGFHQNYPNPFNPTTTIQYELPQRSDVQITIYNLLGREVTTIVSETQDAGYQSIQWNASNVSSGMYFYQIRAQLRSTSYDGQADEYVQTRKMVVLK